MRCTLLPILLSPPMWCSVPAAQVGPPSAGTGRTGVCKRLRGAVLPARPDCPDVVGLSLSQEAELLRGERASPGTSSSGRGGWGGGGKGCERLYGTYPATPWSGTLRKSMFCSDGGRVFSWRVVFGGGSAAAGGPRACFWGTM